MHKSIFALLAGLALFGPTGAAPLPQVLQVRLGGESAVAPLPPRALDRRIAYARQASMDRDRLGACGAYAATLAMSAKSTGANPAAQDRVLKLAFVLCVAGQQANG